MTEGLTPSGPPAESRDVVPLNPKQFEVKQGDDFVEADNSGKRSSSVAKEQSTARVGCRRQGLRKRTTVDYRIGKPISLHGNYNYRGTRRKTRKPKTVKGGPAHSGASGLSLLKPEPTTAERIGGEESTADTAWATEFSGQTTYDAVSEVSLEGGYADAATGTDFFLTANEQSYLQSSAGQSGSKFSL